MIRRAEPRDIARILEMGRAFFAEAGWGKHADFDDDSFSYTAAALIDTGILLVAEKDGLVIGMAGAGIGPAYWNRNVMTGQELFFFCDANHRKGAGRPLITALEDAAKERGVMLFSMSAETGLRSEALGRLYRARGYFPAESLYWRVLQ